MLNLRVLGVTSTPRTSPKDLLGKYLLATVLVMALALLLMFVLDTPTVQAATIKIDDTADSMSNDGNCTLREAIINANNDDQSGSTDCPAGSGVDTITLALNGVYTLNSALPTIISSIAIEGKNATIQRNSAGGTPDFRIFEVTSSGNLTLNNLTVANGSTPSSGGGILNGGALTINESTISGNSEAGFGGGGIFNDGGTLVITDSTIDGNTSTGNGGGGIFNTGGSTLIISGSTISNNASDSNSGGGIHNASGNTSITSSTISGNSAIGGGGIATHDSVTIIGSTITDNTATGLSDGGGIWNDSGTVTLTNTILAGNTATSGDGIDCFGSIASNGHNMLGDDTGCAFASTTGDMSGTTGNPLDAVLGVLQDNGGPTDTHALLNGSPALDMGNPATPGSGGNACEATDQRGMPRPIDSTRSGVPRCDIGAFERGLHADLSIVKRDDPNPVLLGQNLTYTLKVTNHGPNPSRARVIDRFPYGRLNLISATSGKGTCSELAPGRLDCRIEVLQPGQSAFIEIIGEVISFGDFNNWATVEGDKPDLEPDNNLTRQPTNALVDANPISLTLLDTPVIGVGRQATIQVELPGPAPSGGVTATVTCCDADDPGDLAVDPPGTTFIAEGDTLGQVTVTGVSQGDVNIRASVPGYLDGVTTEFVSLNLISLPTTLNVPWGQSASLPISISPNPAPTGGVVITLDNTNPVSAGIASSTTIILEGTSSTNVPVDGLLPGVAIVTASNPNYASDVSIVSVTADLNIIQGPVTFNATLPPDITIQLESGGSPFAAPANLQIDVASDDTDCVQAVSPVTLQTGLINTTTTLSYGGVSLLPCSTTVTASSPNLTSETIDVTVNPAPGITVDSTTVGSGLINTLNQVIVLGSASHGGVTVHLESDNPSVALLSENNTTPGTQAIDLFVANGSTLATFRVHGMENTTGTANITASAPGFANGVGVASVVTPAYRMQNLPGITTSFSNNTNFNIFVGLPNVGNTGLSRHQAIRPGGVPITATVTNSSSTVAQLVTAADTGQSVDVDINVGSSVATLAFDPLAGGMTTVTASIQDFVATNVDQDVTVNTPGISVSSNTVGSGLMSTFNELARLAASNHGGVDVLIESSNPSVALVSPDSVTPGTPSFTVHVDDGFRDVPFRIHGMENATGVSTITASAPGFSDGTGKATIVQPALFISGLATNTTSLSPNGSFIVGIGVPTHNNSTLSRSQTIRPGGVPVTATITNSSSTVAQLVTATATGQSVDVNIGVGSSNASLDFDPLDGGVTTVSATIPDYIATDNATKQVTVSTPGISVSSDTVGSGLITPFNQLARLGATNHGGVDVLIESSDPSVALLSLDANTPGEPSLLVHLNDGSRDVIFKMHGMENATGTAIITASAPGFSNGAGTATVVTPAVRLSSLPSTTTTQSPNTAFSVNIGVPHPTNSTLNSLQAIRPGGVPVVATVTNSAPSVAQLVAGAQTGSSVDVTIGEGDSSTVLAFEPLTTGVTTVSVSIPGFNPTDAASKGVNVITPGITVENSTVGSGLMSTFNLLVRLGAGSHGGVDVLIESSNPSVALVSPDGSTEGSASTVVSVLNGFSIVPFRVHGLEGATGSVIITASATGFLDGTGTATIVQPAVTITGLLSNISSSASNDPFTVQIGVPNASQSGLHQAQPIRPGGTTVIATVTSSDDAVGILETATEADDSVTVDIAEGESFTSTSEVEFDPVAAGFTTIEATIPNFITTGGASQGVNVN